MPNKIPWNKKSEKDFIEWLLKSHGGRYIYVADSFTGWRKKVTLTCHQHGVFTASPNNLVNRQTGCPKCGRLKSDFNRRLSKESVVKGFIEVHGNRYDYSKVVYTASKTKVTVVCKEHGDFETLVHNHLRGVGCPKCGKEKAVYSRRFPLEKIIASARRVHGNKYDYSKVKYVSMTSPVSLVCLEHGEFKQSLRDHIYSKCGCTRCVKSYTNREEFIDRSISIFGPNCFNYDLVLYKGAAVKVTLGCLKCGKIFRVSPKNHIQSLVGCRCCSMSHGERLIKGFLDTAGIDYVFNARLGCSNPLTNHELPFDFYVPRNVVIEYDGEQHFNPNSYWKSMPSILYRDSVKTTWALENGYHLLRVPYTRMKDIPEILKDFLIHPRTLLLRP